MVNFEIINEIIRFWFGKLNENGVPSKEKQKIWWIKDPKIDEFIKKNYEKYIIKAVNEELYQWEKTPDGTLALIIVLDQFSRNVFRNSAKSFTQDKMALKISNACIKNSYDLELEPIMKSFIYMPYMHSEDINDQLESLKKYDELEKESRSNPELHRIIVQSKDFAQKHYEIIKKYGRYPHRNSILGRKSTDEEIEFLKTKGSSF